MQLQDLAPPPGAKVDLVVRSKDDPSPLHECLDSIRQNTPSELYRLIVVDDGGEPPVEEGCADLLVRNRTPQGMVTATNQGLALAGLHEDTAYVLVLDADVRVPAGDRGWLGRMIWELEQAGPQCAAVGATSNASGMAQHILRVPQVFVEEWKNGDRKGFGANPPVPWFTGFAVLLRKSAIARCGLWDTRYNPGQYEDIDYSLQLREAGFTIRVARSVYVHRPSQNDLEMKSPAHYRKWVDKWGIGRLYDFKVMPVEYLRAELDGAHR